MSKGIILETAVPVRFEPSDKSEMVNQLLFGETYSINQEKEKWLEVISDHDEYNGWIDRKQHTLYTGTFGFDSFSVNSQDRLINHLKKGTCRITPGCYLPDRKYLEEVGYLDLEDSPTSSMSLKEVCDLFSNAPYLWGGRTPLGIDCSGFTQLVFRILGKGIPRDASQQVELGEQITFIDESSIGDLAFFDNEGGKITHVGIIISEKQEKKIIHASGRVRIDKIDHEGIFNEETQSYSHKLRTIKTIL